MILLTPAVFGFLLILNLIMIHGTLLSIYIIQQTIENEVFKESRSFDFTFVERVYPIYTKTCLPNQFNLLVENLIFICDRG